MNILAHTNPGRGPDEIQQPTPAPPEIDHTPANPDETDTQHEQDLPLDNEPDPGPSRHAASDDPDGQRNSVVCIHGT